MCSSLLAELVQPQIRRTLLKFEVDWVRHINTWLNFRQIGCDLNTSPKHWVMQCLKAHHFSTEKSAVELNIANSFNVLELGLSEVGSFRSRKEKFTKRLLLRYLQCNTVHADSGWKPETFPPLDTERKTDAVEVKFAWCVVVVNSYQQMKKWNPCRRIGAGAKF